MEFIRVLWGYFDKDAGVIAILLRVPITLLLFSIAGVAIFFHLTLVLGGQPTLPPPDWLRAWPLGVVTGLCGFVAQFSGLWLTKREHEKKK